MSTIEDVSTIRTLTLDEVAVDAALINATLIKMLLEITPELVHHEMPYLELRLIAPVK